MASPPGTLQILLIEDSEPDTVLLERLLRKSGLAFGLKRAATAAEMRAVLVAGPIDIVISDYSLPGFGALEALRLLREHQPDPSFVVISGAVGEETAVEVMRAGASDFVIKSALSRLPLIISREFEEAQVRRARRAAEHDLKESERRLREALAAAQEASQLKTAFLANMSHEIRTPLGSILGYAELAAEVPTPPGTQLPVYLQAIRRNGEQLLGLVGDLLDLTKIEANKLEIEILAFDLRREIESVLLTLLPRAQENHTGLRAVFDDFAAPAILSDPTRVKQILLNLIGNSVKFTSHGEIILRVSQVAEGKGDGEEILTRFAIEDSGIGMTAAQTERLFEPFVQGDVSTTRKFGGTGLGLALSRQLARQLGGDLKLIGSKEGQGSTFEAVIRARRAPRESIPPSRAAFGPGSLPNCRILLVEDSPDNQFIVQHYLAATGASVSLADNGQVALDDANINTYDLILMDMQMPVVDGIQATARLRERGLRTPIIALTAHAFKGAREEALHSGFSDYITKPIDRANLIRVLALHWPA